MSTNQTSNRIELEQGVCHEFLNFFEDAQRAFGKGSVSVAYLRTANVICGHHDTRDTWNLHDELVRTRKHPFFWPPGFYTPLVDLQQAKPDFRFT